MKIKLKSETKSKLAILFGALCFLSGCADVRWFNWLTGEPEAEVLDAPRVVKRLEKNEKKYWPNLGDIPKERPVFSALAERKQANDYLVSDKYQAQAESARLRQIDLPQPLQGVDNQREENSLQDKGTEKPFSALRP